MKVLLILLGNFELLMVSKEYFDLNEKSIADWKVENHLRSIYIFESDEDTELYKKVYLKYTQYELEGSWEEIVRSIGEIKLLKEII